MTSPDKPPSGPALFGREEPLAAIAGLLHRVAGSRGGALLLRGVAGIGKTALLRQAVVLAEEQGFEVRQATGVPIESSLPFGALSTLLAPDRRDQSLEQRAPALAASLGLGSMLDPPTVMAAASEALEALVRVGRVDEVAD